MDLRPARTHLCGDSGVIFFAVIIEIDSDDLQEGLVRMAARQPGRQQIVSARPAVLDLPAVDPRLVQECVEAIDSLLVRVVLIVLVRLPSLDRVPIPLCDFER